MRNSPVFLLLVALCSLPAFAQDYSNDDYIRSHFFYGSSARVSHIQKEAIPSLPREKPCSQWVFPAAPGQMGKSYFVDALISYPDVSVIHTERQTPPKLPAMDKEGIMTEQNMCRMENKNNKTPNPKTGTRWCVIPRVGRYLVMSDAFHDTCGNYFRGFWETATAMDSYVHGKPQYTSMDEHAVTTSLGRYDGMEKDPQFSGAFNAIQGPTGEINANRFLFFIKASEKDMESIDKILKQELAPKGKYHRCKNGIFVMDPAHCPK